MGQKVNPNVLRLGKFYEWDSKYIEKKSSELPKHTFHDLNIKTFLKKILKKNGMELTSLKLNHTDKSIHIFIAYFLSFDSIFYKDIKNKKIKLIPTKQKKKKKKTFNLYKQKTKHYLIYQALKYKLAKFKTTPLNYIKKIYEKELHKLKIRRILNIKLYNNNKLIQNNKNVNSIKLNSFLNKLLNNLKIFITNKFNVYVTFEQVNKSIKQFITKNTIKTIKKICLKLRKYKESKFYKEGVNIIFSTVRNKNSAILLANFIATQLKKQKRHNFFLRFIKTGLNLFTNKHFSIFKGIKIKIKGRLNGTPRARHKIIKIKSGVSNLTLKSNISYSESTAFTTNGTIGVKVWFEEK